MCRCPCAQGAPAAGEHPAGGDLAASVRRRGRASPPLRRTEAAADGLPAGRAPRHPRQQPRRCSGAAWPDWVHGWAATRCSRDVAGCIVLCERAVEPGRERPGSMRIGADGTTYRRASAPKASGRAPDSAPVVPVLGRGRDRHRRGRGHLGSDRCRCRFGRRGRRFGRGGACLDHGDRPASSGRDDAIVAIRPLAPS